MVDGLLCGKLVFLQKLDLTDQSHANWIITYQNMEKEWGIQALCGGGWRPILYGLNGGTLGLLYGGNVG